MGKYHSTMSRRDFLKALGLGTAGLTGAMGIPAALGTDFHDLDELMASPMSELKRPGYVREAEKPSVEIDWKTIQRFDEHLVMWYAGLRNSWGPDNYDKLMQKSAENRVKFIQEKKPGYTLRDQALHDSANWAPVSFIGPQTSQTPEELGVPRWEGKPEENARMIRAFLKLHGAAQVGFVELESQTTEKLIYSYDTPHFFPAFTQGKRLVFSKMNRPLETDSERFIPYRARWVIVYTIRMSDILMRYTPGHVGLAPTNIAYQLKNVIQGQLQNFLRSLGYMGLGEASNYNALGTAVGLGVMAGLGETSRVMHLVTPEYGLRQRVFKVITDLPLPPGKPVHFGVMDFCRVCKKCADACPVQAIPHDTEPSWEVKGSFQSPGVKIWRRNEPLCNAYMISGGMVEHCSVCFGVCPLSKGNRKAIYHDLMRATISTTPVFNRFFRKVDDFLGYGIKADPEKIWDMDLPTFGWD